MKQYQYVVFDVDGTLLDTAEGIVKAVKETMRMEKLEIPADDVFRTFIGPPIQNSFEKLYGFGAERAQEMAAVFRNFYRQDEYILRAKPYEGIYEVCRALASAERKIGIATYKRQDYAEKIVRYFQFDRYTDYIFGADHENRLKKVDIIRLCLSEMGCKDYGQAVMIGDSDNDAIGAQALGIDFIGVTYGFGFLSKEDVNAYANVGCADTPWGLFGILGIGQ